MCFERPSLGLGVGWRPELALFIDRHPRIDFVEVIAEDVDSRAAVSPALMRLRDRGVTVIPHGVSLSLGGADIPDPCRLAQLNRLAERLQAPLVSEHIAFVRGGGIESGHLLPVPRTRAALDVLVEDVQFATSNLSVPLALENIAALFEWPDAEMNEAAFLSEVLERTNALLLLDLENLFANARNHGCDCLAFLEGIPLERLAYVHVAGGVVRDGLYHDTHTQPVPDSVLHLLEELSARWDVPGVMLERDDEFPTESEMRAELNSLAAAVERGRNRREAESVHP